MDVTKSTVSLVWGRPKHDGGSKLIGYYVEYTKLPEEKWTRCNANCMNIQTENYVVTNLQEGQQYQFRIIAKTAINSSLPSELSDPIPVIAENGTTLHSNESDTQIQSYTNNHEGFFPFYAVAPRVELGVNMKNLIVVKAGENVFLDAEVFGKPLPKVSWKKDGVPLVLAEGMKMSQKKHLHLLELYSVTRKETGDYTITAENVNGTKYATIKVKVLGKLKLLVHFIVVLKLAFHVLREKSLSLCFFYHRQTRPSSLSENY